VKREESKIFIQSFWGLSNRENDVMISLQLETRASAYYYCTYSPSRHPSHRNNIG